MDKFVLIPDSFKGTMSSAEICELMDGVIKQYYPDAKVVSIPVADGGEGSVECFLQAMGGERIYMQAQGPLTKPIECGYGLLEQGNTAIVEMASCAGLPLIEERKDPLHATTYGVGEQILHAAESGVKKIIVGLGGSCTNDGGCGAAAAVGVRFYNEAGETFVPTGGTLHKIERIDCGGKHKCLEGIELVAMCDIDNPMYGETGAAAVFGPQKGATPEMVEHLDNGVRHLCEVIKRDLGQDLSAVPGTGAAGAMGAGMMAFFGARLQMGIDTVLDTVRFEQILTGADMVFTGEGRIDGQSLRGKVVIGVARRAKPLGVPVTAIVGDILDPIDLAYGEGVSAIFSINRMAIDFKVARNRSKEDLVRTIDNLMRFYKRMNL